MNDDNKRDEQEELDKFIQEGLDRTARENEAAVGREPVDVGYNVSQLIDETTMKINDMHKLITQTLQEAPIEPKSYLSVFGQLLRQLYETNQLTREMTELIKKNRGAIRAKARKKGKK
jgi:hypothetical protein